MPGKELSVRLNADTKGFEREINSAADAVELLEERLSRIVTQQDLVQKAMSKISRSNAQSILVPDHVKQQISQELEGQRKLAAEKQRQHEAEMQRADMASRLDLMRLEEQAEALRQLGAEKQRDIDEYLAGLAQVEAIQAKTRQEQWKAFQQEQANHEKAVARAEREKQLELEKERIRQQSLNTLGQGDLAAQRLAAHAERTARAEYEAYWQARLLKEEFQKTHPILGRIQQGWEKVDSAIQRVVSKHPRLQSAYDKIKTKLTGVNKQTNEWRNAQLKVLESLKATKNPLNSIWTKLKGIAATYISLMGAKTLLNTSDLVTSAKNKLNYVYARPMGDEGFASDGSYSAKVINKSSEALDKMYNSAQKVRMSYTDMMSNVTKTMTLAGDAFGNNTDNAVRFQEIMAEAYAIGGASADEMSSSMGQLVQALGAGVLQGDELRSVREGASLAYDEIEKFVQGVLDTDESLKELGSQGVVTSDMVVAAVMQMSDKMDKAFANTEQTFAQTWEQIKNAAIKAFTSLGDMLTDKLNEAIDNGMMDKIESLFTKVSQALQIVFQLIANAVNWVIENWGWLQYVILGGLLLMIAYTIMQGVITVTMLAIKIAMWWKEASAIGFVNALLFKSIATIGIVILAVLGLLLVFIMWKQGAIDTCSAICSALMIVGIAGAIIAALFSGWIVAIIFLVIAAIGLIIKHLDKFLGVVYSFGAILYNIFFGVIDGVIQAFFSNFVDPLAGIIEWFVNAWSGGFDSVGDAFANFCGQLLSGLIGLLKPFAVLLDKVFGWDVNGAIESAQANMRGWGKNESAVTYTVKAPTASELLSKAGLDLPERIKLTDAWDKGNEHGQLAMDKINSWGSQFQTGFDFPSLNDLGDDLGLKLEDPFKEKTKEDYLADLIGDDAAKSLLQNDPNLADEILKQNGYDPSNLGGLNTASPEDILGNVDDIKNSLNGIGDDTSSIKDSMEMDDEDIEALRRLAEMEWKKEFTTATITVDMSNYNTINGEQDVDGILAVLHDRLYEEMDYLANGVYA